MAALLPQGVGFDQRGKQQSAARPGRMPQLLREGAGRCRKRGKNRRFRATGFACHSEHGLETLIYQTVTRKSNSWPRVQQ